MLPKSPRSESGSPHLRTTCPTARLRWQATFAPCNSTEDPIRPRCRCRSVLVNADVSTGDETSTSTDKTLPDKHAFARLQRTDETASRQNPKSLGVQEVLNQTFRPDRPHHRRPSLQQMTSHSTRSQAASPSRPSRSVSTTGYTHVRYTAPRQEALADLRLPSQR